MKNHITDKVVMITGGSSGFGLEATRMLLELGARVVITGRSAERLEKAEQALDHRELLAIQADATRTEDWRRSIDATLERFGHLDVLVNNHGAGVKIADVEAMGDEEIATVLDINLVSVIKGCREAIAVMKPRGHGHIVNVSSACARHSWPSWGVYTAAKAGMVGFTRCLHLEMAEWGGKATSYVPGAARTGFCEAAGIEDDWMTDYPSAEDFARTLVHCIDVPEGTFIEEVHLWGTKQVKEMINPF